MPEIARFYGIIIKMYFVDHNPPHFQTEYGEYVAEYDIQTLKILAGKLPSRANALVLEWASNHREELMRNWEKAQTPEQLDKIEQLD